jgi:hypothetical protein
LRALEVVTGENLLRLVKGVSVAASNEAAYGAFGLRQNYRASLRRLGIDQCQQDRNSV